MAPIMRTIVTVIPPVVRPRDRCRARCLGFVLEPVRSAVAPAHGYQYEPVEPISQIACFPF